MKKRFVLALSLLLMWSVPVLAGDVTIHRPDGRVIVLRDPVNVVRTYINDGLTTYTVTDGRMDDSGESLVVAVRRTGEKQTMTMVDATGKRTDIPPGSRMERDLLALIATHA